MQVVLIVDDSQASNDALQPLREGLTAFSTRSTARRNRLVTSGDRSHLATPARRQCAVSKPASTESFRGRASGRTCSTRLVEVSQGLQKREAKRPVIVVLTLEGETEFSNRVSTPC